MKPLQDLLRKNIRTLRPYSCARDEFKGKNAQVFLDANESPYNAPFNRYPDPLQQRVKDAIAPLKQVPADNIFLGNGSDEAIDLLFRLFCEPCLDNVVAFEPTYGMYKVCSDINDIAYRPVPLDAEFQMHADALLKACDAHTKLIFICTPNNPTGNAMQRSEIEQVLRQFEGIVVVDEAYSDFCQHRPFRLDLATFPNLVVLNTFSKAFGCAAIRLGMAFASTDIISMMNRVKYPYNVNNLTAEKALETLSDITRIYQHIVEIKESRDRLMQAFSLLPCCQRVYPSDANFFLAKVTDAGAIYRYLVGQGIIVRNRSNVALCTDCLRITVGDRHENEQLLKALRQLPPA